jgi:hypothetical protein
VCSSDRAAPRRAPRSQQKAAFNAQHPHSPTAAAPLPACCAAASSVVVLVRALAASAASAADTVGVATAPLDYINAIMSSSA